MTASSLSYSQFLPLISCTAFKPFISKIAAKIIFSSAGSKIFSFSGGYSTPVHSNTALQLCCLCCPQSVDYLPFFFVFLVCSSFSVLVSSNQPPPPIFLLLQIVFLLCECFPLMAMWAYSFLKLLYMDILKPLHMYFHVQQLNGG